LFLSALADPGISRLDLLFAFITRSGKIGISLGELAARTGWLPSVIAAETDVLIADSAIVEAGGRYLSTASFESLRRKLSASVKRHHESDPLAKGVSKELLREGMPADVFAAVLASLVASGALAIAGEAVAQAERKQSLTPAETAARTAILDSLQRARLEVPKIAELLDETARASKLPAAHVRKILQTLIDSRHVVKVSNELFFSRKAIDALIAKIRETAAADRTIDVSKFKEISGVSRKYAIPLLEYFDAEKITVRAGDKRLIR
jgi:selenocysteine-specific elongation factor